MEQKKKMGRPTDNPKTHELKVRVTEELNRKVEKYAHENGLNKAEVLRMALENLLK